LIMRARGMLDGKHMLNIQPEDVALAFDFGSTITFVLKSGLVIDISSHRASAYVPVQGNVEVVHQ